MPNYVEVNDEGAARSSASQLSSLGQRLDDKSLPPEVVWGDDEFGQTMREAYQQGDIPTEALDAKPGLGEELNQLGEATIAAVTELTTQELTNAVDIDNIQPPTV